jgi:hypothetical protein
LAPTTAISNLYKRLQTPEDLIFAPSNIKSDRFDIGGCEYQIQIALQKSFVALGIVPSFCQKKTPKTTKMTFTSQAASSLLHLAGASVGMHRAADADNAPVAPQEAVANTNNAVSSSRAACSSAGRPPYFAYNSPELLQAVNDRVNASSRESTAERIRANANVRASAAARRRNTDPAAARANPAVPPPPPDSSDDEAAGPAAPPGALAPAGARSRKPRDSHRAAGFTKVEDYLVCRSFVAASEDPLKGTSQKGKTFKLTMYNQYVGFVRRQLAKDQTDYARISCSVQAELGEPQVYPARSGDSIYTRWRDQISPRCCKFLGIEETFEPPSGVSDPETIYDAIKEIFEHRHPEWKNFDDYRQCKDYLQDKPKFMQWKRSQDEEEANKRSKLDRPLGNKKSKQALQDAKLIETAIKQVTSVKQEKVVTSSKSKDKFYDMVQGMGSTMMEQWKAEADARFVATLPTPERKEWQQEQFQLRMVETRMKRRKLESELASPSGTTVTPGNLPSSDLSSAANSNTTPL